VAEGRIQDRRLSPPMPQAVEQGTMSAVVQLTSAAADAQPYSHFTVRLQCVVLTTQGFFTLHI
jgi:hypothetical protein